MSNPTSNYSFVMPTSTDLVTDLPADFEVFGQAVDTQLKALNPSTTLGDVEYRSATANTNTRLGIGSTGDVLTVSGGVPTWAAPAGGADNYTLINAGGTALTGATTITVSGISNKNSLIIVIQGASSANSASNLEMRFNADSTLKYNYTSVRISSGGIALSDQGFAANNSIDVAGYTGGAGNTMSLIGKVDGSGSTGLKTFQFTSYTSSPGFAVAANYTYSGTSTISSVSFISSSGNFDAGTVYIYGA